MFLFVVGLFLLYLGAESIVFGTTALSKRINISSFTLGLTLVAFATSLPEALVSIFAQIHGSGDIALGNVVGSNLANFGLVLPISLLIFSPVIPRHLKKIELPLFFGVTLLVYLLSYNGVIGRVEAGFLFLCFVIYLVYLFWNKERLPPLPKPTRPLYLVILVILVSFPFLIFGARWTYMGALEIAHRMGISERIISLSLIAIGTSLPELMTNVIAACRRKGELLYGNIVGSNLFNTLFILPIAAWIRPIGFSKHFIVYDFPMLLGITFLIWLFLMIRRMEKWQPFYLLFFYAFYIGLLYGRG